MKSSTMKAILKALHILLLVTVSVAGQAAVESNTYILTDHLGSPILATDDNGETLWREDYQPYGTQLTNEDGDNSVGFTGHKDDKALGVTYMQGRWYHQGMGRFLAIDPVRFVEGNPASFNRYAYANNNPYKYIDPDGEFAILGFLPLLFGAGGTATTTAAVSFTVTEIAVGVVAGTAIAGTATVLMNESSEGARTLDELEPIHDPNHAQNDPAIGKLSDEELVDSLTNPSEGDKVTVKGNKVYDGNTRVNEAKARGFDGDMDIPVDELPNSKVDVDNDPLGGY